MKIPSRNLRRFHLRASLVLLLQMSITSGFAQSERVTLNIRNGSVQKFIKAVEKQTPYTFVYRNNIFGPDVKVTIECQNQVLSTTLTKVFAPMNIGYSLNNSTIVLVKKYCCPIKPKDG